MAIETGDRYLESLFNFVDRNAEPLVDGTVTLKLNPAGLRYVQSRLEALEELERLLNGAPVDYLRAYVADLGDHRKLEQLRRILGILGSLKVISGLDRSVRDPTPVSLRAFGRLRVLELRGCDLSSSAAKGLLELRGTLEKLICHNSTDALRHVFASRLVDIKCSLEWKRLTFVSCACNGLILMDESLQLLPSVETLDLSRNRFAKLDNLRKCNRLSFLDLGFNHLRTIASLREVICPIIKLVLRNNALTTLRGIENLRFVQGLDLSYNVFSTFSELEILASLPSLKNVWLEGNPICCARWYRAHFFSLFPYPERVKLDGRGISRRESWERCAIIAGRGKLPAGHGFYFPANMTTLDEESVTSTRRKASRLASIRNERQMISSCSDEVDQEVEDNVVDEESQITCLIDGTGRRAKDKADAESSERFEDSKMSFDSGKKVKMKKRAPPMKNSPIFSKLNDMGEKGFSKQPVENCNKSSLELETNEDRAKVQQLNTLTAIEDIIFSRQSSQSSASPPQYRKDILHRRQNWEEKFLNPSVEPSLPTSSESSASSSDDDSCDSGFGQMQRLNNGLQKKIILQNSSDCYNDVPNGRIDQLAEMSIEEDDINRWALTTDHHNLNQDFMKLDARLDVIAEQKSILQTMQKIENDTQSEA